MTVLNQQMLLDMFETAAKNIIDQVPHLNALDGKTGDGDHGTTMLRVCHCIEHALENDPNNAPREQWDKQVNDLGWAIMSQDGGSAGMLVGNLFMGIGEGLIAEELSPCEAANAIQSGVDRVIRFSGAHAGEKTMLDALIPVAQTMQVDANSGVDLEDMFEHAALAARQGAEATKAMVPKRGRAKNMGERAIGHIDPGATSMAILFESFNEALHKVH
ncbi:dihydroxyacetone kinase subunit L [Vibrio sp. 99-70-13A1]|uniref:dihydroxyacetone kinase subunit L n=1 Tax=Vibrio sp. 99-70-13A1 TaxID=2607601 RepID=UPI00149374A4|nr:dihydroxyacetone kinase subunit L [Vibrio sp. 99-70-13A1]NOH95566.1 dihydroxyacetone kinase subunit L [Vibrio sp. 99-70-13A1]